METDRAWLEQQVRALGEGAADVFTDVRIHGPDDHGVWWIHATIGAPGIEASGHGPNAEAAFMTFLASAMRSVDTAWDVVKRSLAPCWVCGSKRERVKMETEILGGEIWWLCDRCQQRRSNAERIGVIWPTDYTAWIRHWRAEQRTAGRDDAWLDQVEAEAQRRYDVDPFLTNRMMAVLQVAGQS